VRIVRRILLPALACGALVAGCAPQHAAGPAGAGPAVVARFAPRPAGFGLTSFADPEHGLALGETQGRAGAQLLATQDGGATWRALPVAAGWTFQDVRLAYARRGFAVGATPGCLSGRGRCVDVIFSTADGGLTWRRAGLQPGQYQVLWSHGERAFIQESPFCQQVACPNRSVLYATNDGGQHWWALGPRGRLPQFSGVGFSNATDGLGLDGAGRVYETSDGGRTWTSVAVLTRLGRGLEPVQGRFSFAGAADFVTFCDAGATGNGGCENYIFRSDDGGHTWRQVFTTYCVDSLQLAMRDASSGAMVTSGFTTCEGWPPVSNTAYRSSDGGTTWVRTWTFPEELVGSGFLSPERGWVTGGGGTAQTCFAFAVCAPLVAWTADGGRTWRQAYPALAPTVTIARTPAGSLVGIGTALDPLAVLTERGGRWRQVGELPQEAAGHGVDMVVFASGRNGWAAALQGPLFATRDGGRTWRALAWPGLTNVQIYGLAAERGRLLLLGQSIGCMGKSSCPTTLWRLAAGSSRATPVHAFGGSWQFTGLAFTSASRGYALGTRCPPCQAALWRTANGGRTWSWSWLPGPLGSVTGLGSPAPGLLAAASSTGYALRASPGAPWQRVDLAGRAGRRAVQLVQTGSGQLWLLTSDGLLFRSSDRGRDWH